MNQIIVSWQMCRKIDNIYFEKDQEVVNNGTETEKGIRIYSDSKKEI